MRCALKDTALDCPKCLLTEHVTMISTYNTHIKYKKEHVKSLKETSIDVMFYELSFALSSSVGV